MANPLRGYREQHGLSQRQLAKKLRVSRSLIGMLETGAKSFTAEMAIRIEKRLGIDRVVIRPDYFRRRGRVVLHGNDHATQPVPIPVKRNGR